MWYSAVCHSLWQWSPSRFLSFTTYIYILSTLLIVWIPIFQGLYFKLKGFRIINLYKTRKIIHCKRIMVMNDQNTQLIPRYMLDKTISFINYALKTVIIWAILTCWFENVRVAISGFIEASLSSILFLKISVLKSQFSSLTGVVRLNFLWSRCLTFLYLIEVWFRTLNNKLYQLWTAGNQNAARTAYAVTHTSAVCLMDPAYSLDIRTHNLYRSAIPMV